MLEMAFPAPSSGEMIQISVSYSWPIYQHYSNVTVTTSCYLTVGLLFVYSLSGYDFTSSFFGVGKLKFFDLYTSNTLTEEDLKVFKDISSGPEMMTDEQFRRVVKFTLAAYQSKGAATCDLHTARMKGILSPQVDSLRQLPPSRSALYYHTLRSAYASVHLWGQADLFAPGLPAFVDWGWEEVLDLEDPNALLLPTWSIMFDISGAYERLSKTCNCGEKNGCLNRNCSCSGTRCLPTCKCRGECRKDSKDQAGAS